MTEPGAVCLANNPGFAGKLGVGPLQHPGEQRRLPQRFRQPESHAHVVDPTDVGRPLPMAHLVLMSQLCYFTAIIMS